MSTPRNKKDEVLLARLKEASRKLHSLKKNGFIAYSYDVDECMRRIHDLETRVNGLESWMESQNPYSAEEISTSERM